MRAVPTMSVTDDGCSGMTVALAVTEGDVTRTDRSIDRSIVERTDRLPLTCPLPGRVLYRQ